VHSARRKTNEKTA